jgi:hypothetical protein
MKAIENAAFISIGRACGFAGLAIFCLMFGLSFELALAARAGGVLCAVLTAILLVYGYRARVRPYKRTELWIILDKAERPPAGIAQRIIGQVLHETYLWFARRTAVLSVVLLGSALALRLYF